ncbi:hypothetical protein IF188_10985 [Microbacterium sp. NEAU-LLC]|uniref:Uncharacterized protein n=1 Tax=Microbacterium helvum TaxID=2773713 RepID=A0ABR8NNI7_9MICO|nr:hypothetical protein [Microbacterium helvum]MBD3942220.1 hypothetical protein [Microbacterium helvum]
MHPLSRGGRIAATAAALAVITAVALAGCTDGQPSDDEFYAAARQQNLLFKETVAAVQVRLYDGDW